MKRVDDEGRGARMNTEKNDNKLLTLKMITGATIVLPLRIHDIWGRSCCCRSPPPSSSDEFVVLVFNSNDASFVPFLVVLLLLFTIFHCWISHGVEPLSLALDFLETTQPILIIH